MGPYTDWMVHREGASLFLVEYIPDYVGLLNAVPKQFMKAAVRWELRKSTDRRPTVVLDPQSVTEFFYGFTDVNELRYIVVNGDFPVEEVKTALTVERNFEDAEQTIGGYDVLTKGPTDIVGLTESQFVWTKVGFADPVENFEAVLDGIGSNATTFPSRNETYSLLMDNLPDGHLVQTRPTVVEGIDAEAYGRQYTVSNDGERTEATEVFVYANEVTADDVRAEVNENSRIASGDRGVIERIRADGRVVTVDFSPILTGNVFSLSGYTRD